MNIENIALHFYEVATSQPEKTAIVTDSGNVNYSELKSAADELKNVIAQLVDGKTKSLIGVSMEPGANLVSAVLSIFLEEGIYLPIDLKFSEARLTHIFEKTYPEMIITDQQNVSKTKMLIEKNNFPVKAIILLDKLKVVSIEKFDKGQFAGISLKEGQSKGRVNDEAYLFYTSGSTGTPKAVLGSLRSLSHFINWEIRQFGFDEETRVSWLTQFTFDASLRDIFIPLCSGGTLMIPPVETRQNTIALIDWLNASEVSVIHTVPSVFRLILQMLEKQGQRREFRKLSHILLAGELLYAKDISKWNELGCGNTTIINLYGATETTLVRTFHVVDNIPENAAQGIHVGQPIDDTMILILNARNELCKIGEVGQVYIKTKYPTYGYFGDQERTDAVFVRNPLIKDRHDVIYKTGDLGRYLKDRNVEILGRSDSQVKIRGVRVDCTEVADALRTVEGINDVVVQGVKNSSLDNELVAYYTGEKRSEDQLITALTSLLNREYIPDYFIWLEAFPLNVNGKIDKKALPKPERLISEVKDSEKPQGSIEQRLSEMWKEILNVKAIGRETSFFAVGGHSLRAIELVTRIAEEFSVAIKIVDVFDLKTIREQAIFINRNQGDYKQERIPPIGEKEAYELSYVQKQLWLMDQLMKDSAALNIHWGAKIKGNLNIEKFNSALEKLFGQYEILRTTFKVIDNQPMQVIHEDWKKTCFLQHTDISDSGNQDQLLENIAIEAHNRTIDIESGPLTYISLIKLQEEEFALYFTMHHIISDAASVKIMIESFLKNYHRPESGQLNQVQEVAIQYKDFAAWLNSKIESDEVNSLKSFWKEYLPENIKTPDLPYDRKPGAVKTFNGRKHHLKLTDKESQQVKQWIASENISYFNLLTAVINLQLYLTGGQRDLVIGTPSTLRRRKELEMQIGYFIDALLIRTKLDLNQSFGEFQNHVKQQVLLAFDHGEYPYQKIREEVYPNRDLSDALFNVSVAVIDGKINAFDELSGELTIESLTTVEESSKFDLTIISAESNELEVVFEYNVDLFDDATIESFAEDFHELLKGVLDNPGTLLRDFQLVSDNQEISNDMFESFTGNL